MVNDNSEMPAIAKLNMQLVEKTRYIAVMSQTGLDMIER
jgi:hypothetical protein